MEILLLRIIEAMLTPPGVFLWFILAGVLAAKRYRYRLARNIFVTGSLLFVIVSLPVTAKLMYRSIESHPPLRSEQIHKAQAGAIVILGAGRYKNAPEFGQDRASANNLERLRYAVYLHHLTGLPLLASGGKPHGESESEAHLMQRELAGLFGIHKVWLENNSNNTWENARNSAAILKQKNIQRIFLVTQAWHMPRAVQSFATTGLDVIPAPTGFRGHKLADLSVLDFMPRANAFRGVQFVLHEWMGRLWYKIRYRN